MLIGAGSVLIYTLFGGMWSVAITDYHHCWIGMLYIGGEMTAQTGGVGVMIEHTAAAGQFGNFWPDMNLASILGFVAALCTMMLGSIPQQDIFQRLTSSKNVNTAVQAALLGGVPFFLLSRAVPVLPYWHPQLLSHRSNANGRATSNDIASFKWHILRDRAYQFCRRADHICN